jgi:hypothetical protein
MKTFKITACQEEYTTYWVQGKDEDDASENWADNGYDSDKKRINNSILTILYIEEETSEEIAQ